jgi:hypothetical protein
MNFELLSNNLTSPALLFFALGIFAVQVKSDLKIPENSAKFISLYLLFAIGFKGGQELSHSPFSMDIVWALGFGILLSLIVPLYTFFILKQRLTVENSAAIAASYGSVSAVTFVAAASFLEMQGMQMNGHMVAVMALMEAPSIIIGMLLLSWFNRENKTQVKMGKMIHHALTNGSVLLILGSLVIGLLASEQQAEGIKPFTTDIFKGFLAIFLLDMGIVSGGKLAAFIRKGRFTLLFAILIPLFNGSLVALASGLVTEHIADRFIFSILAASASYIAVPAAMKLAAPKANPGLYVPMALAVTFPFNITLGMPIYMSIINWSSDIQEFVAL